MKTIFMGNWKFNGIARLKNDFQIYNGELKDVEIILAYYSYEDYEGQAFVLFRKEGKLYEVNGSHCSCYGLEDQWTPEEVLIPELEHRLTKGKFGFGYGHDEYPNKFNNELKEVIDTLKQNN